MGVACRTLPVVLLVLTCVTVVAGDTILTFTDFNNFKASLTLSRNITRSWVHCLFSNKSCDFSVESTNDTNSFSVQHLMPATVNSSDSLGLQQNVSFCQWDPNTPTPLSCMLARPGLYNTYSTNANRCTFLQFTNETNYTNYVIVLWNHDCTVDSTDTDFIRFSNCGTSKDRQFSTTTSVPLLTTTTAVTLLTTTTAVTLLTTTTAVTLLTTSSTTGVNNLGLIAGCVTGGVIVLIIIIVISVLVCRVKRSRQKTLEKSVRQDGGYTEVDLTLSSAYTEIDLNLDSKKLQDCIFYGKSPSVLNGSEKDYQKIFVVSGDNNRDEDKGVKKSVENLDTKQNVETNALGAHRYSYARVVKNKSQDGGQFIPDVTQTEGQVGPPDVTQTEGQVGPPDVTQTEGQVGPDVSEYSRLGEHPRVLHNLYNMVSVSGQSLDTGSGQHHSTQHIAATDRPIEITVLRPRVPDNSISNGYSQVDITRNNVNDNVSCT